MACRWITKSGIEKFSWSYLEGYFVFGDCRRVIGGAWTLETTTATTAAAAALKVIVAIPTA
jgi:hypothetical protein